MRRTIELRDGATRQSRGEHGLTLIETLCAAAVLTVAVLGLSQVALTTHELQQSGAQKAAATRTLQDQMARVQSTDFSALQTTFDGAAFDVVLEGATTAALPPQDGDVDGRAGSIAVTAPTGAPADLLLVVVRVDWSGHNGPQSITRALRVSRVGSGS